MQSVTALSLFQGVTGSVSGWSHQLVVGPSGAIWSLVSCSRTLWPAAQLSLGEPEFEPATFQSLANLLYPLSYSRPLIKCLRMKPARELNSRWPSCGSYGVDYVFDREVCQAERLLLYLWIHWECSCMTPGVPADAANSAVVLFPLRWGNPQ